MQQIFFKGQVCPANWSRSNGRQQPTPQQQQQQVPSLGIGLVKLKIRSICPLQWWSEGGAGLVAVILAGARRLPFLNAANHKIHQKPSGFIYSYRPRTSHPRPTCIDAAASSPRSLMLPCQPRNLSKPVKPINRPRRTFPIPPPDLHNEHLQRRLLLPFLNAAAASLGIRRGCPATPHTQTPTPDTSPVIPPSRLQPRGRPATSHTQAPTPFPTPLPYNREACNNARPPGHTPHPSRSTGPGVVAHTPLQPQGVQ
ncbi:hypothetical protein BC826DRAFT_227798 [Russula brevipes]|nr:hypothetical protein BC826DRAFT_227798 [Russula brevipes]